MIQVLEKPRAKGTTKKAAPASAVPAKSDLGTSLGILQDLLDRAWQTDEPQQNCGDSNRLLATATSMVEDLQEDYASPVKVECGLYDIAAQVKASLQVPGDTPSTERVVLAGQIGHVLSGLLNDPLVLKNWGPVEENAPASASKNIDFIEVIPHARSCH